MEYNFDVDKIKQQVADVIKESQGYHNLPINVDGIINDWLVAKKPFIEKMNGNLIYQTDRLITFELDPHSKKQRLHKFADLVSVHYKNQDLSEFLYEIKPEDFYNNITSQEYEFWSYKDDTCKKIPKNYKIIKLFKFFENNEDILKDIQNEASRLVQEDCITGYLCFSVHPLDFLSASENIHNWRSCHALDGEYRSGNLNYLMDSSTVICYLRAEKQAILPHFPESVPWNSKKWRVWLYFSNDMSMLFAGRQYPFSSETGLYYIKDHIMPQLGFGFWKQFNVSKLTHFNDELTNEYFSFEKMVPVGDSLKPLRKLMENGKRTYMYNDVLSSSCYDALYAFKKDTYSIWRDSATGLTNDKTHFTIGEKCKCPICGDNYIDFHEIIACSSCAYEYELDDNEDYFVCDICGTSVHYDDLCTLDISGSQVCPYCYQHETYSCQCCGVVDLPEVVTYYEGQYLCSECINELEDKQEKEKPDLEELLS